MLRRPLLASLALLSLGVAVPAFAQAPVAPAEIKVGHLHAGSGPYASISMPVYLGLKLWVDQTNAEGGVFVKAFGKKIPLKLLSYDDQSSTATAATLYNQLITQDKVHLLVSDSGSVLTSVGVPIAREHKTFLFDPTGTGAAFFKDNKYIALIADPVSTIWPKYVADFLKDDGVKAGLKRVALLYSTNDFTGTQATAVRGFLTTPGSGIEIVYDQGVPTNTSNYTVLINNIAAASPDAVIALGYVGNDIALLRNLQDSGQKFRFLFAIYPGIETEELLKNVGAQGLDGVFTYVTSAEIAYKPEVGMSAEEFRKAFLKANAGSGVAYGFNAIAGYTTGVVLGQTLANTAGLEAADLRSAIFSLSGKLKTLDGTFELDENGAQVGEITPLGQIAAEGKDVKITVVYPHELANGHPVIGKP